MNVCKANLVYTIEQVNDLFETINQQFRNYFLGQNVQVTMVLLTLRNKLLSPIAEMKGI